MTRVWLPGLSDVRRALARMHARSHARPPLCCFCSLLSFYTSTRHFTSLHFASYSVRHFCSASLSSYLIIPPLKPLKYHFSSLSSFPSESPFCSVIVLESHLYPFITAVIRFIHISPESGERLVLSWSNLCNLFIKSLWFWEIWFYSFFQKKIICLDSVLFYLFIFL